MVFRRTVGLAVLLLGSVTLGARAQNKVATERVDVAITYAGLYAGHTNNTKFWFNGGGAALDLNVAHGFGVAASFTGLDSHSLGPGYAAPDLFMVTFGPTYTYTFASQKKSEHAVRLYSEALMGPAFGINGVFAPSSSQITGGGTGVSSSANSFAFQVGGAVDVTLSRSLALRAVQLDYLRTQFPNGTNNIQNSFRIGAGVMLRLGTPRKKQ